MDKLSNGGETGLDSVLTVSQLRKQDILARYEHMKKSARESRALAQQNENVVPFIVRLTTSTVPVGTPRMLSDAELDELRDTKRQIAEYMKQALEAGFHQPVPV